MIHSLPAPAIAHSDPAADDAAFEQRMLHGVISSMTDLTYAADAEGRLLWANDPYLRFCGTTLQACRGRFPADFGYPDDVRRRLLARTREVFRHGHVARDEVQVVDAQGVERYYEYIFSPALGARGGVDFVVACRRDISDRRRSEEALKESIAEFRTLASAMPQIVWSSGADGEFIYLNQRWLDYAGLSLAESLGQGWRAAVHPHDLPSVGLIFEDALRAGDHFTLETRIRNAEGQYRWWLMRGVPVIDARGRPLKWIGTCTDIDELKEAEREISRSNAALQLQGSELRTLFDLVPAMVWFMDTDSRVLQINHRAASQARITVAAARGQLAADLFPEEGSAEAEEDRQALLAGKPLIGRIQRMVDADGKVTWVQGDKVPCFDAAGRVIGVMVMKHDITQRKRVQDTLAELNAGLEVRVRQRTAELALARDEAEHANQAKSAFLATMSHEIRTPMSGLVGLLELLDLTTLDADQRSTLAVARQSGQALKEIIDGILDFSKIEANSLELNPAPTCLRDLLEGILRLHAPVANARNLALTACVDPGIAPALAIDALRLGQILNNFVSNAIKFTERGSITLTAECLHRGEGMEHLRLVVRDTGIGIPPDRLGRLFQPFGQADASTSSVHGGTGLGLFIARRLAELMRGTVTLASEPGAGTTLTLLVAFASCEEGTRTDEVGAKRRQQLDTLVARRPAPPTAAQAQADGTLLLIVDDHPINRTLLQRQVATLGYASEIAADGAAALQAWDSGRFAAILTDCNMPGMSGFELARAVREREAVQGRRRSPVIGCTANAMAEAADACLAAGMDAAIIKPVALDQVCACLDRWIPLPHLAARATAAPPPLPPRLQPVPDGLLDMALLDTIAAGDAAALAHVLSDLRKNNEADASELRRAVRREDFPYAVRFAHRMRGACAMLGATLLADACAQVQGAADRRDAGRVHACMQDFEMELLRLNNHLDTLHGQDEHP